MRETFVEKSFTEESHDVIQKAISICEAYARQGFDLSLRQLYYQFVSRNWLKNTEQNYKRLGSIVGDARMAGLMDWIWLVDRGRSTASNSHWENPGQIVNAAARGYRIDSRENQPFHIEVMVEKQALEGVLEPVCRELDVAFTANKGYSSLSHLYEVGKRLARHLAAGKRCVIVYLGDHDPSGIDMSRDVGERLRLFAGCEGDEDSVLVERVALNMDQVRRYRPPENPTKLTDSRAGGYISRFGHSSWELDALEPTVLAELVRAKVGDFTDDDLRSALIAREAKDRDSLLKFAKKWKGL